jgi:hypothetical protein
MTYSLFCEDQTVDGMAKCHFECWFPMADTGISYDELIDLKPHVTYTFILHAELNLSLPDG